MGREQRTYYVGVFKNTDGGNMHEWFNTVTFYEKLLVWFKKEAWDGEGTAYVLCGRVQKYTQNFGPKIWSYQIVLKILAGFSMHFLQID